MSFKTIKQAIWFAIHNHRRNRFVARAALFCRNLHRASEHPGYDVLRNGEQAVLAHSVSRRDPILFDVGANVGEWSVMARRLFPQATIYPFELNPNTATELAQRFTEDEKIHVQPYGLAASSGEMDFYAYSGPESVLSGLRVPLHSHVPYQKLKAAVRRGDEVCTTQGVNRIDFLKVDAEGADLEVITGFGNMLDEHRIAVIQFEHEFGRYLKDFYDFLGPKGYAIGKLYANYVDFREHTAEREMFLGPNYIAIPFSKKELLASLKGGWKVSAFSGLPRLE